MVSFSHNKRNNIVCYHFRKRKFQMNQGTENECFKTFKNFTFKILMTFEKHKFINPLLFLLMDFLQLCTLHYLYINPKYPHIKNLEYPSYYFSNIYPFFYVFKTNYSMNILINILTLAIYPFFLFLFIIGVQFNLIFIIYLCEIAFLLYPFSIYRLAAEIIILFQTNLEWKVGGAVLAFITISMGILILVSYRKIQKFIDFFVTLLICLEINTFVILGFLTLKLILIGKFAPLVYAKNIKLWFEVALLVFCTILLFIPENIINYIMLFCFVFFVTVSQLSSLYETMLMKKLPHFGTVEEGEIASQLFSMSQINYIRKIEEHRSICMLLECDCESFSKITTVKEMNRWSKKFYKEQLKLKDDIESRIEYAESCFSTEFIDFSGFFYLFLKKTSNTREQYLYFQIMKKYENSLKEQNKKTIGNIKGKPYDIRQNIIDFETKLINILTDIREFWISLLDAENLSQCEQLAKAISEKINSIGQYYEKLSQTYEEIRQIEFYYSLFKKIVLQKHVPEITSKQLEEALMLSSKQVVIQITQKACQLFCRKRKEIIHSSFHKLMPHIYSDYHSEWVQQWFINLNLKSEEEKKHKIIYIEEQIIKVLMIKNIIIPRFSQGILILSKFSEPTLQKDECYLLLDKNSLEIVGYEQKFFQMVNLQITEVILTQLKKRKIFDFFPKIKRKDLFLEGIQSLAFLNTAFINDLVVQINSQKYITKKMLKTSNQSWEQRKAVTFNFWKINLPKTESLQMILLAFRKKDAGKQNKIRRQTYGTNIIKQSTQSKKTQHDFLSCIAVVFLILLIILILGFHLLFEFELHYTSTQLQFQPEEALYFYQYVETCIFYLQLPIGKNSTENLKKLWIEGYGDSSQIFNTFEHAFHDSFFGDRLDPSLIQIKQNLLYKKLEQKLSQNKNYLKMTLIVLKVMFGLGIILTITHFLISGVRIILIERKVNKYIYGFSALKKKEINTILQKFDRQTEFLLGKNKKEMDKSEFFHKILRQIEQQQNDSFVQLKKTKNKLKKTRNSRLSQSSTTQPPLFPRKDSFSEIVSSTLSFFIIPLLSNLIFILIFFIFFILLNIFYNQSVLCFEAQTRIFHEPILLLQSFQEEYLHISLDPALSLSQYNFKTKELLEDLPQQFNDFKETFQAMNTKNICTYVTQKSLLQKCVNQTDMYEFGFQVIYQYLDEHFRKASNLTIDSSMEDLVIIMKEVLKERELIYKEGEKLYIEKIKRVKFGGYFGSLLLMILGVTLQCKTLYFLRTRVKKTMNLFIFVPEMYRSRAEVKM